MLQVQREVLRPRLRPSLVEILLVGGALIAGVVGRLPRRQVRVLALEACLARVEIDRMKLRDACAAGTASKRDGR